MTGGPAIVSTAGAPRPVGPYSQAVEAGGFLFLSGQIGLDPGSGQLVSGGASEQTRAALNNLAAILRAAGGEMEDVVRVGVYLKDIGDFAKVNEVYGEFFSSWKPTRTTIGGLDLPKGALVEIDAVARTRR
ncbi:MAG: 2-iminobutanoate/2-iminopropanoate deaminase [Candidatus Thermoplasmatota archaeon]|nr:2-iminobutanoate/2-iminopropanoate deaminase [Candidatus Thermoplasmatota archaeon]